MESGQPADFVNFSLESDVTRLADAGLVADDWNAGEHDGLDLTAFDHTGAVPVVLAASGAHRALADLRSGSSSRRSVR